MSDRAIADLERVCQGVRKCLTTGDARRMVLGCGFSDERINAAIAHGVEEGLKPFVVAPEDAKRARKPHPTRAPGCIAAPSALIGVIGASLMGVSLRRLRETFGHELAEFEKVINEEDEGVRATPCMVSDRRL